MTGTNEKLRALFLSALMVVSVFGATVALSGSAAALTATNIQVAEDPVVLGGDGDLGNSNTAFTITEETAGEFGSSGTAEVSLPSGVTFNQSASDLTVRQVSSGSITNVQFTDASTLTFEYDNFQTGQVDNIKFGQLTITTASDVGGSFAVSVRVGTTSADKTINTAAATFTSTEDNLVRGQTGVPLNNFDIDGSGSVNGVHAQGENITISIPQSQRDRLSFDTSATVTVSDESGDALGSSQTIDPSTYEISFEVAGDDLDTGDKIDVAGLQVNTTGVSDDSVNSEFTSGLNVTTSPVGGSNTVEQQTASQVDVDAPAPGFNGNDPVLAPGETGQTITAISVNDETDAGGALAAGTNVTITIPAGNGITFDQSQDLTGSTSNLATKKPSLVDQNTLTAEVDTSSTTETLTFDNIAFNVSSSSRAKDVNLTVTTTATGTDTASVAQNTSVANDNRIDVTAATLQTNGNQELVLANDADGEVQLDPDTDGAGAADDITLTSQTNNDIASSSAGTNITLTLPAGSAVTFDESQTYGQGNLAASGGQLTIAGDDDLTLVDSRTLVVTVDQSEDAAGSAILNVQNVRYNVTGDTSDSVRISASVNRTGVSVDSDNFVNVTLATADTAQGDAQSDGSFGATGSGDTILNGNNGGTQPAVGDTVTAEVRIENSTGFATNGVDLNNKAFGGADVNLEVTDTPSGVSASNVTLNASSVTTAEDGNAAFNVTLGDKIGTYNVTASSAANPDVNVTMQFVAQSAGAAQLNVTQVKDGLATGSDGNVGGTDEAFYRVRVEDAGGNIDADAAVDVGLIIGGDAQLVNAYETASADGSFTASATGGAGAFGSTTAPFSSDADNRLDYDGSADNNEPGVFYIALTDTTEESVQLTVDPESGSISDDSATAEFFVVRNVNVELNRSTTTTFAPNPVQATAVATNGNGDTVTVPGLSADYSLTNGTVATVNNSPVTTNATGVATTTVSADNTGTTDVEALIRNKQGAATLTVDDPSYDIVNVSLTPDTVDTNSTVDHDLSYTVTGASNDGNSDTYTVTLPASASFVSANSLNVTDANGDSISISSSPSLADANGGTDNQITFGIQPDSSLDTSEVNVDANVTVDFPDVSSTTTVDVTLAVSDSANGNTNATTPVTIEVPSPANFSVSNVSPDGTNITQGDNLTVTADVTNVGELSGNQTVEVRLDIDQNGTLEADEERASTNVSLDAGNSTTVSFEFQNVTLGAGTYTYGVVSDNDTATATFTVEEPFEQGAFVTITNQTSDGTTVTVDNVTLERDGYVAIHSTPVVPDNGTAADSVIGVSQYLTNGTYENVTVTLFEGVPGQTFNASSLSDGDTVVAMPHEETNGNMSYDFVATGGSADGPYVTADGSAVVDTAVITVEEPAAPANFAVSDLSPMDVTVTQGDVINVSATVTNTGGVSATQTVEFRVGGTVIANQSVSLNASANTTVEFTGINTSSLAAGNYTHGVYTEDGNQTATLTVENATTGPDVPGVSSEVAAAFAGDDGTIERTDVLAGVQAFISQTDFRGVTLTRSDILNIVQYFIQN